MQCFSRPPQSSLFLLSVVFCRFLFKTSAKSVRNVGNIGERFNLQADRFGVLVEDFKVVAFLAKGGKIVLGSEILVDPKSDGLVLIPGRLHRFDDLGRLLLETERLVVAQASNTNRQKGCCTKHTHNDNTQGQEIMLVSSFRGKINFRVVFTGAALVVVLVVVVAVVLTVPLLDIFRMCHLCGLPFVNSFSKVFVTRKKGEKAPKAQKLLTVTIEGHGVISFAQLWAVEAQSLASVNIPIKASVQSLFAIIHTSRLHHSVHNAVLFLFCREGGRVA